MTTAQDIAAWLLERIRTEGRLSQDQAVQEIPETFGPEWVRTLENGHTGIHQEVLKEFRKAHGGTVQWDRDRRFWSPKP
ncbi:hypothetical protein MRU69_04495 [Kocuria flava]|uniref:DUF6953 family protein n=1 Tax=Kocuria flava TaxID=446860 RepID=UPI001FF1BB3D|nr:hypothetical protein [Kocuria flava]MCJ8504126.1 hypothetical protein [Kocuria flava]